MFTTQSGTCITARFEELKDGKVEDDTDHECMHSHSKQFKHVYTLDGGTTWFVFVGGKQFAGRFFSEEDAAKRADDIIDYYRYQPSLRNAPPVLYSDLVQAKKEKAEAVARAKAEAKAQADAEAKARAKAEAKAKG